MIPKLVAHRGFMEEYPENTLLAIEAALQSGACMVEFDVQMCADGQLVLLHDTELNRTAGFDRKVFEMSLEDLSTVSVHEPLRFGDRYLNIAVPTLTQAMTLVAAYPGVTAFVEIKAESIEHWGMEKVMDELLRVLQPYRQQCVIISYSLNALQYIRRTARFRLGWVLPSFDLVHYQLAEQLEPEYLICNHTKIPDDRDPWNGSWRWMLYDISIPEQAMHWASRGVELIETRNIGAMLQHDELQASACNNSA